MSPLSLPNKLQRTFDEMVSRGCGNPNCSHNHAREPLYLHSKCHPGAPLLLGRISGKVLLMCCLPGCDEPLLIFPEYGLVLKHGSTWQTSNPPGAEILNQSCHPDSALWASYRLGSGTLLLTCFECQQIVAEYHLNLAEIN